MSEPKQDNKRIIKLRKVRIAFPQLFEKKSVNGGAEAYSAAFLFPRDHEAKQIVSDAIRLAAKEKWGAKADQVLAQLKAQNRLCLYDGNTKAELDGYEGNLFVNANNKTQPKVRDRDGKTELDASDGKIYSGCYVNCSLEIWAMENKHGKRVNASLRAVVFNGDGDAFAGGGAISEDEFDDLAEQGDVDVGTEESAEDLI